MILIVLTIAFIVIVAINTYKTAKENGYSAMGWTALSVVLFFGVPFVFGLTVGMLLFVLIGETGAQQFLENYVLLIDIALLVPGVVASILVLRHVSQIRDDDIVAGPPPPGQLGL
ncbi:MAG TPA: hypothetical protein VMM38_15910 [Aridibacter sp.]|nr:hypothetical protein [Aridibacter sp.]